MKRWGFLTGATLAAFGVWAFYALTEVTDTDRLLEVLVDNCLPYIETGVEPFADMGRRVGVYDDASLSETITGGGSAVLFGNRFVAQWGDSTDVNSDVRVCQVKDSYATANSVGFVIDDLQALHALIDASVLRGKGVVATSKADSSLWVWEAPDEAKRFSGLRVILTVLRGGVGSVLVGSDLP